MSRMLRRRDVHPDGLIDGRPANGSSQRQLQRFLVSQAERDEAEVEQRLRTLPGVTRPNLIALISPKGGVGKTVSTFLVGNLLASHLKVRVIAVDANPDFGTLARLVPDGRRSERTLADLLADADRVATAAAIRPYVSKLPSGLDILAAPREPDPTATAERYGELTAFLATFYEVVLLDLGTGVTGPLARFAVERADQVVVVTTTEWVTAAIVLDAMPHLRNARTTVALNKAMIGSPGARAVEHRFRAEPIQGAVTIPHDERLARMLDTGTYSLDALDGPTRLAIKRLGLAVAEQLV